MEKLFLSISQKIQVNANTWVITFNETLKFYPGQFIMIETPKLVRKPFVLGKWDKRLSISVQVKGEGTKWMVEKASHLKCHGPLGKPFDMNQGKGLFISSPTCLTLANILKENFDVDIIIGSRTPLLLKIPYETVIGDKKFLKLLKSLTGYDWYLVSGSVEMEKVVYKTLKGKKLYFSLEEFMGCGIGACKSCAVETKNGIKHVCTDGPIFEGDELCW
ncbi:MAG: dihydroorotate dehydrogenase [Thermotogae bacterium]|nr:dihydroorotate dehydrogenase [Thermotogota bacterium]